MIRITKMHKVNVAMPIDKQFVTYGEKLTAFEEHQMCHKILTMLMHLNINAEVSTNAQLPSEVKPQ